MVELDGLYSSVMSIEEWRWVPLERPVPAACHACPLEPMPCLHRHGLGGCCELAYRQRPCPVPMELLVPSSLDDDNMAMACSLSSPLLPAAAPDARVHRTHTQSPRIIGLSSMGHELWT